MKEGLFRKGLACAVIFLFVGISAAPAVTSQVRTANPVLSGTPRVNTTKNNDLVKITVQLCKPDRLENHTVWLTQEQATELDNLIDSFKAELDGVETLEETIVIYKNMMESLYNLSLFPSDISVDEAKQLMTGADCGSENLSMFSRQMSIENVQKLVNTRSNKIINGSDFSLEVDENTNLFCLISGETASFVIPPLAMLSNRMVITYIYALAFLLKTFPGLMKFFENFPILNLLEIGPMIGSVILFLILWSLHLYIPIAFGSGITFGAYGVDEWGQAHYNPSDGWIHTFGAMGKKIWENGLYGQLYSFLGLLGFYYIGVIGFTGITIYNSDVFYLGFAPIVKISHEPLDDSSFVGQNSQQSQSNPSSQQSNQLIQNLIVRQQTTR